MENDLKSFSANFLLLADFSIIGKKVSCATGLFFFLSITDYIYDPMHRLSVFFVETILQSAV
jgi:hypothetical protein